MLAGGKLQRRFSVSIFHQIHCGTGLTGIGAASIIVSSEIAEFEEKIAAYRQGRFAVGVSSGTDALLAALGAGYLAMK